MKLNKFTLLFVLLFAYIANNYAQQFIGLGSGNYSGVTGLTLNPSSIADSRHKFDINLFSISSYFDNNLVDIKRDAFYRGLFFKSPYNNDYGAVRRDLLTLQDASSTARVNGLFNTRVQAPLSLMITTGPKSAIGLNIQSRVGFQTFGMARNTAQLIYEALDNPALQGRFEDNSGLETNYLRWQEVGLTYARVLHNSGPHFLKVGITGKWLMGQASALIQSNDLQANFNSSQELSLQSPRIRYYRSEQADMDGFDTQSFFKDIEDHQFGWDAGFTYEFRGNFKKYKYIGVDSSLRERRDLNKYTFRLAAAIMDGGRFTFDKQPFTNDHSANFSNWNFGNVRAGNFSDFDTAYANQVQYRNDSKNNFTVATPAALSANFDLRIHKGFYLNAAVYTPLTSLYEDVDVRLRPVEWFAITPRFESRVLGIYLPVTRTSLHERTDVGLTLRMGPVFLGSNNIGSYLFNKQLPSVDVHAGFKIGITHGKPSKILKTLNKWRVAASQKDSILLKDSLQSKVNSFSKREESYLKTIDSLRRITDSVALRNKIIEELKLENIRKDETVPMQTPAVNVIINNYSGNARDTAAVPKKQDTLVINNRLPSVNRSQIIAESASLKPDSILAIRKQEVDYLLRRNAEQSLRLRSLDTLRRLDSIQVKIMLEERFKLQQRLDSIKGLKEGDPDKGTSGKAKKSNTQSEKIYAKEDKEFFAESSMRSNRRNVDASEVRSEPAQVVVVREENKGLEREIARLRRDLAMQTSLIAASVSLQEDSKKKEQAAPPEPISNKISVETTKDTIWMVTPTKPDTLIASAVLTPVFRIDTIIQRDTVRLPGAPVALQVIALPQSKKMVDTLFIDTVKIPDPQPANIYFSSGSAALDINTRSAIQTWTREVRSFLVSHFILLDGHTDATGSPALNKRLAQKRIDVVAQFLKTMNIKENQIKTAITLKLPVKPAANAYDRKVSMMLVPIK